MYCRKCGKELNSGAEFCSACGVKVVKRENQAQPAQPAPTVQPFAQQTQPINRSGGPCIPQSDYYRQEQYRRREARVKNRMPMKWFNFLIYFALLILPFIDILSGLISIGTSTLYGLSTIALAIYALVVRSKLANYKENAPSHLITYNILSLLFSLIQGLYDYSVLSDRGREGEVKEMMLPVLLVGLIGGVVMICCNISYFRKRGDYFTNV